MKEIIAIVRMNKTNATKKALIECGAAGFTATKVNGRGRLVEDQSLIAARKADLMRLAESDDIQETEMLIDGFLDGTRFFPRRIFCVAAHDEDVPKIVQAIAKANKTSYQVGDGKIFVTPLMETYRVRTGEAGDSAI